MAKFRTVISFGVRGLQNVALKRGFSQDLFFLRFFCVRKMYNGLHFQTEIREKFQKAHKKFQRFARSYKGTQDVADPAIMEFIAARVCSCGLISWMFLCPANQMTSSKFKYHHALAVCA